MLFRPRKLRRDSIAFDAVRSWLEQCQTLHEKECGRGSKTRQFSSLHMIDCHSLRVIPAPRDCEYVALSYVWGVMTEPLPELESGYLEFDKLPAVIKDAISVTKELGFGHIWIDRYCIPQNDEARHEQIQHMHSVDTNAELTIVAACSPHPGVGLAGVSRLRDHQIHIHLDEVDLVEVAFHRQKELVQNSIWNSRGWTFQEAMLSRRLLIFTDKMVQLQCRENTCLEALHRHPICGDSSSALHRGSNTHHLPSSLATIFPLAELFHEKDQYATVWDIIKTYNRRMLSFESDYLNAFLGVLNTCINVGSLAGHMWGL
ncbi:HET-domain-containing protein, partial [Amniculicola lignicola CBS 123094]